MQYERHYHRCYSYIVYIYNSSPQTKYCHWVVATPVFCLECPRFKGGHFCSSFSWFPLSSHLILR